MLAAVVAAAAVMMVLVLTAFIYIRTNANTVRRERESLAASYAAESGANLAMHCLGELETIPGEPFRPFPNGLELPDGSRASVTVVPLTPGGGATVNSAADIHSLGRFRDTEYRIIVKAVPWYLSGFALLVGGDIPSGFFTQGSVVDGPVHANGFIHFDSTSPDSSGDPWVRSVSTSPETGGFVFSDAGLSDFPHPPGSRTWVRPWPRHAQGSPSWSNTREPVDMPGVVSELTALQTRGLSLRASRILLDGSRVLCSAGEHQRPDTVPLAGVEVLCVRDAGMGGVTVKSLRPLTAPLTLITPGNLIIGGPIDGGLAGYGGPLGLVALGDIIIETPPGVSGRPDWEAPWDIETGSSFVVRAFLAAPQGSLRTRSPFFPEEPARFSLHGGLAVGSFAWKTASPYGYSLGIAFDPGMINFRPPGFPQVWKWTPVAWDMDVEENLFREHRSQ